MPELMTFPKTVDEFMEQYKIVDSDEVYTNGTELVPIFRMKQWFEHIDTVPVGRCKDCKHYREHDEIYKRMWKSDYDGHCMWWNAHSTHADGYCHEWKEKEVE